MTTVPILSEQSIQALRRDHERLRYEVHTLQTMLRAFMSAQGSNPARLWRATLNEAFGATTAHYAAADLLHIDGTDTTRDVSLYDPLDIFAELAGSEGLYCLEQIDRAGVKYYVPLQTACP